MEKEEFQQDIADAKVETWNSLSSFSSNGVSLIDPSGPSEQQINELSPSDQIGWGGKSKIVDVQLDPLTPMKSGTPKRKFSPEGDSPYGRVRKMSTSVEASPLLRSQLVPYDENNQLLPNGAPDLISGIGRLQLRGDNIAQNNDGDSTAEVASIEPINIVQRLMRQAPRTRTTSLGAQHNERNRRLYKRRQRTMSLSSQRRIDMVFTPKKGHKMVPANNEHSPQEIIPSKTKKTD